MGWESQGARVTGTGAWVKPTCVNVTWEDGSSMREEGGDCDALNRKKPLWKDVGCRHRKRGSVLCTMKSYAPKPVQMLQTRRPTEENLEWLVGV